MLTSLIHYYSHLGDALNIITRKINKFGFTYLIFAIVNKYFTKKLYCYYMHYFSKPSILYPIPKHSALRCKLNRDAKIHLDFADFESPLPGTYSDQHEVILTGYWAVPWLNSNEILLTHYSKMINHINWSANYRILYLLLNKLKLSNYVPTVQDSALFVTNPIHYGHWLIEDLPKLQALINYDHLHGIMPNVIVPKSPPDYLIDSLVVGGVPRQNIVEYNHTLLKINNFIHIYPGLAGTKYEARLNSSSYKWLRDHYYELLNLQPSNKKRLFLSKQSMNRKHVYNFDELLHILSKYKFDIIEPERLNFKTTIKFMSEAEIVVGPQGSNMHNVMFTKNAQVLDLKPTDRSDIITQFLTNSVGSIYFDLVSDSKSNENGSFFVNPTEFEEKIRIILNK